MSCEDMKAEDCTRVRIGLYLAWKARLVIDYEDSFLCNRLYVNPRSPQCLYKPEGLERKEYTLNTIVVQARLLGFRPYNLVVDQLL